MNNKYNLFLDDDPSRIPHKLNWIELPLVEWVIVRTYDEFVKYIERNGLPTRVSFDHDLADNHYQEYHRADQYDKQLNYNNCKEKTGYHAALFLAEYCIKNKFNIPQYFIHSMNYMGKQNILSILTSAQKIIDNNP